MWRFRRFGITQEVFDNMKEMQNHVCGICKKENTSKREFDIDHCHTSGQVRGLLCNNCNRGIGHLQNDVDILNNAIQYLTKFKETK